MHWTRSRACARFDNGAQYKSGEFRAAANVIGLAFEHISVGVTQQKGGIGPLISTLRRGCVRPYRSFQDAKAHRPRPSGTQCRQGPLADRAAPALRI